MMTVSKASLIGKKNQDVFLSSSFYMRIEIVLFVKFSAR